MPLPPLPRAMYAERQVPGPVALVPLGEGIRTTDLALVEEVIRFVVGAPVVRLDPEPLPFDSYTPARQQYDAAHLLRHLASRLPENCFRLVAITREDLYAPDRPFCYGYAEPRDGVAVISRARLETLEQFYKVIAHELGHVYDNPDHCNKVCLLRAVRGLSDLDELPVYFCQACLQRLRRLAKVGPRSAEGQYLRGGMLLRHGRREEARRCFETATQLSPTHARYWNDLGVTLLVGGDRQGAQHAFLTASMFAPDFPHPFYNLAVLTYDDNPIRGEEYVAQGLGVERDYLAANAYLARFYLLLVKMPERAMFHLRCYRELRGDDEWLLGEWARLKKAETPERSPVSNYQPVLVAPKKKRPPRRRRRKNDSKTLPFKFH